MISLTPKPQGVLPSFVHGGSGPALEGHYRVEILPCLGTFTVREPFCIRRRAEDTLACCAEIAPGDVTGIAQVSLVGVPVSDVLLLDESDYVFVSNVIGEPMSDVSPHWDESDYLISSSSWDTVKTDGVLAPPSDLLSRLDPDQENIFLALWKSIFNHLRDIRSLLDYLGTIVSFCRTSRDVYSLSSPC